MHLGVGARARVPGVESQWSEVSDCDWTVREPVNDVVTGNYWAAELTGGKTIDEVGTACSTATSSVTTWWRPTTRRRAR